MAETKECPKCASAVGQAAKVCPSCRYSFRLNASRGAIAAIAVFVVLFGATLTAVVLKVRHDRTEAYDRCQIRNNYELSRSGRNAVFEDCGTRP